MNQYFYAGKQISQTEYFFRELYIGQSGFLELRPVADDLQKFRQFVEVKGGDMDFTLVEKFVNEMNNRKAAAYFGVALRSEAAVKAKKGNASNCQVLTALFVDVDFKHRGESISRSRLAEFPLEPTLQVYSGGGIHPYWRLQRPLLLGSPNDMATAKIDLHSLAHQLKDVVDVSVSEPVRILRIPGSYNFKKEYGEPRLVTLETAQTPVDPPPPPFYDDDLEPADSHEVSL